MSENPPNESGAELQHEDQPKGFGSKLASLGRAALDETKRNARLVALKGNIQKLKTIDLNKAHYALGKKAYELRFSQEKFGPQYEGIAEIEKDIAEKRQGVTSAVDASKAQMVKDAAISAKMTAEAEALEIRLKNKITALGRDVEGADEPLDLKAEMDEVLSVREKMVALESEYGAASADHEAQGQIKALSASIAKEAGTTGKSALAGGFDFLKRQSFLKIAIAVILLALVVAFFSGKPSAPIESQLADRLESIFNAKKQELFSVVHPVGTAKRVKVHDVQVEWKNGVRTNLEKDILQFTVRFTIYWEGPITKDGYTKATQTYDEESDRWIGGKVLQTNGITNSEVNQGIVDFGVGFLQEYLKDKQ